MQLLRMLDCIHQFEHFRLWNSLMLEDVSMTLNKELMSKEVADKKEYRRSLALGFLFKYFQMVSQMNQVTNQVTNTAKH